MSRKQYSFWRSYWIYYPLFGNLEPLGTLLRHVSSLKLVNSGCHSNIAGTASQPFSVAGALWIPVPLIHKTHHKTQLQVGVVILKSACFWIVLLQKAEPTLLLLGSGGLGDQVPKSNIQWKWQCLVTTVRTSKLWTPALASLTLTFCIFEVTAGHISDGMDGCSVGPCRSFQ